MSVTLNTKHLSGFVRDEEFNQIWPQVELAHRQLMERTGEGSDFLGWVDLPENYDKEEFARDWELYKTLRPIADQIGELLLCVEKCMAAAGNDCMSASLDVYAEVKRNKQNDPGIKLIAGNMSEFFKKTKKKKEL